METQKESNTKRTPKPFRYNRRMSLKANYAKIGALTKFNITPKELRDQHLVRLSRGPAREFPKVKSDGTVEHVDLIREEEDAQSKKRKQNADSLRVTDPLVDPIKGQIEDPNDLIDEMTMLPKVNPLKRYDEAELVDRGAPHGPNMRKKLLCETDVKLCEALMKKWGDDYGAMSKDFKINRMQHTAAELKRKCEEYLNEKKYGRVLLYEREKRVSRKAKRREKKNAAKKARKALRSDNLENSKKIAGDAG
ncbi:putative Ribosome biogenesis protein Nop16 [Monocercomonoides exilis]|uniref:putative Ribosome biogenesis protein Nop16 n=1 Tax=Monocercomonoides exilis TaxID=2049356 RepID=UPI0035596DAE|nr:putative Ribosome biogenesis protein Nop16 [Monocercomonoides exilis]|eukprot:MONOS_2943.1-p1 / transcript=MONOS_2943.1 / gene=MONOS_2943 / organism=Monocercomonoides_exilis_PA203 / gene_product=unspecified product / transcript_product=unspecified product / location=Mono_scaffold00064:118435-119248(-) / protein_length=249 / sequence_SO=supercontig / SO=protein_coding / is_pseudo=false